jgi:hypothetical protein
MKCTGTSLSLPRYLNTLPNATSSNRPSKTVLSILWLPGLPNAVWLPSGFAHWKTRYIQWLQDFTALLLLEITVIRHITSYCLEICFRRSEHHAAGRGWGVDEDCLEDGGQVTVTKCRLKWCHIQKERRPILNKNKEWWNLSNNLRKYMFMHSIQFNTFRSQNYCHIGQNLWRIHFVGTFPLNLVLSREDSVVLG